MRLFGIMLLILLPMAGTAGWYVINLQRALAISQANEVKLEQAVATNEATIESMRRDYALQAEQLQAVNNEFAAIREQNQNLIGKLERHDIGLLGVEKPGLVVRIINRATDKANRCFEILSGAELTEKELEAENGNQFNSECPWLFTPSTPE